MASRFINKSPKGHRKKVLLRKWKQPFQFYQNIHLPDAATWCSKLYNHPLTTLCSYDGYLDCLLCVQNFTTIHWPHYAPMMGIWIACCEKFEYTSLNLKDNLQVCKDYRPQVFFPCYLSFIFTDNIFRNSHFVRKIFCFKISHALEKPLFPKGERASLLDILCFSVHGSNSGCQPRSQCLEMRNSLKTNPSPIQEIRQQKPAIMRK